MRSDIGLDGLRIDMDELEDIPELKPMRAREDPLLTLPQEPEEPPKDITAQLKAAKVKGKYILIDDVLDMLR